MVGFGFFLSVGSVRALPTSGAPPPASGTSLPSGHQGYSQFGQGDVQNGIPTSTAPMQRYVQEEKIIMLGLSHLAFSLL